MRDIFLPLTDSGFIAVALQDSYCTKSFYHRVAGDGEIWGFGYDVADVGQQRRRIFYDRLRGDVVIERHLTVQVVVAGRQGVNATALPYRGNAGRVGEIAIGGENRREFGVEARDKFGEGTFAEGRPVYLFLIRQCVQNSGGADRREHDGRGPRQPTRMPYPREQLRQEVRAEEQPER